MSVEGGMVLADIGEDALLADLFPLFAPGPRVVIGPGDDAAVLAPAEGGVVVTTDSMVRGRDWLDAWSTASDVAAKLLSQNLADVAAMGAHPTAVVVAIAADPTTPVAWVREFATSLSSEARRYGVSVVGGDVSSASGGALFVSMTALGDLQGRRGVRRGGGMVGDVVALHGTLGHSGAGLALLRRGWSNGDPGSALVTAHLRPPIDPAAGVDAARAGATSQIDISDGLLRDLHRVAAASRVQLELNGSVLADAEATMAAYESGLPPEVLRDCVRTGGEEHSLVATFPAQPGVPAGWQVLGVVRGGAGVTIDDEPTVPAGWDHFGG